METSLQVAQPPASNRAKSCGDYKRQNKINISNFNYRLNLNQDNDAVNEIKDAVKSLENVYQMN